MSEVDKKALVAYIPVIHAGYMELFSRHEDAVMHIVDEDVISDFPHLRKDIRALPPDETRKLVEGLAIFPVVKLLGKTALRSLEADRIVMPDDEVSRQISSEHFPAQKVVFEPVFLRWHRNNSFINIEVNPDRVVTADALLEPIIKAIYDEAGQSTDWWRRVGAAIIDANGRTMFSGHNHHLPTDYTPWIDGDPRNNAYRGVATEAATAQHAEASIIAQAAREGVSVEGSSLFVSTFPCPSCAKLIAEAGISKCYFTEGYAMTDGFRVMKDSEVEIVKIDGFKPDRSKKHWKNYPEKG